MRRIVSEGKVQNSEEKNKARRKKVKQKISSKLESNKRIRIS